VKGVIGRAELLDELERHARPRLRHRHGIGAVFPRADGRAHAEHVGQLPANRVPVGDGEPEVFLHRFAVHEALGVVVFEGKRVLRGRTLVLDLVDPGEEFADGGFFHIRV